MGRKKLGERNFPSAAEELRTANYTSDIYPDSSYKLAFQDLEFLADRRELRPVRFQLELMKPDLILQEQDINSTIVMFGSARFLPQDKADAHVEEIRNAILENPDDPSLPKQLKKAHRLQRSARYYHQAQELARVITEYTVENMTDQLVIITGGGPGIMEAANRGAYEAGGKSIGLSIVLPFETDPNPYITPELCFQFHYFALRKMHFLMRSKALIAFPGGFGTLDELFETLTLIQTRKARRVPILLFNKEFWQKTVNFEFLVDEGTIDEKDLQLFQYVDTADEAWKIIKDFYQL
ncbi:MAG: TIGR00730 family Rossman fold protein [Cellvibrionaceae bacterium]